jgi:hypothetical protein
MAAKVRIGSVSATLPLRLDYDARITSAMLETWAALVFDNLNAQTFSSDLIASVVTMGKSVTRPLEFEQRLLRGVTEAPLLSDDGSILTGAL